MSMIVFANDSQFYFTTNELLKNVIESRMDYYYYLCPIPCGFPGGIVLDYSTIAQQKPRVGTLDVVC
jgi:hypothetical protein